MWNDTRVNIGSHSVILDDGANPEGMHSFGIDAEPEAVILVRHAQMEYHEEYESTSVTVRSGDSELWLSPHIFGVLPSGNTPSVYISTDDPEIEYVLRLNGQELKYDLELLPEDHKTHLSRLDRYPWFTAGQNDIPAVELTIRMPGGPTVIFETLPVKPEWAETR